MSRTDKTQPFRVRLWDGTLRRIAVHDHRNGICDLPDDLAADIKQIEGASGRFPADSCRWEFAWTGTSPCCCWLCHDSTGHRAERRADRHATKRELRNALKAARADWSDLN